MPFQVSSTFHCHTYVFGKSVRLLQEWLGWWTRYEELFWSLLLARNYSIFHCGTVTRNELVYLFISQWFAFGTVFFITTLVMTIAKPYRKAYMNYLDTLLLSNCTILCYALLFCFRTQLVVRILIATPIAVFIVSIVWTV